MRLSKRIIALAVLFTGLAAEAQQEGKTQINIQYNVGLPMGSFKDVVGNTSFNGLQASVRYGLTDKLSLGLGTGFQDFYQKYDRQLYKLSDGSDLSAVRSFSIQTMPILAEAKWSFTPSAIVQPYVALGAGGNLINYSDYAGEFSLDQKTKFGFAARPEAGISIPFHKGGESGFTLGASYNIMPFKSDAVNNLNSVGIHAGINLPLRK